MNAEEDKSLNNRLREILSTHNACSCPSGHKITWGCIAWNNGSTEYGTDYCSVEIICSVCDVSIAHINSWYPGIDTLDELLDVLDSDWND